MPQENNLKSTETPKQPVVLEYSGPTSGKPPIDILQLIANLVTIVSFGIITLARGHGMVPIGMALAMKLLSPGMRMDRWFYIVLALTGSGFILLIGGGFSRHRRVRQRLTVVGMALLAICLVMLFVESDFLLLTFLTSLLFAMFATLSLINLFLPENK